jgi:glucose-1-phosphate cytidylyltransferase
MSNSLPAVILAGGLGTRIREETEFKPKPMVEIGGKPILWHILKMYEKYGYNDFIICLGYKATYVKEYFYNYYLHNSDITIELANNNIKVHYSEAESFKITLIDTGLNTNTAGRLKKIHKYVKDETFMLTYGDGVSDINFTDLIKFHKGHGRLVTLTSIQVPGRFGNLEINENGDVESFIEKPMGDGMWINGGFFVLEPQIFNYLEGDMTDVQWEKGPLINIAKDNQLSAYKHYGFWKCMDALRDRIELEDLWNTGKAKWKTW